MSSSALTSPDPSAPLPLPRPKRVKPAEVTKNEIKEKQNELRKEHRMPSAFVSLGPEGLSIVGDAAVVSFLKSNAGEISESLVKDQDQLIHNVENSAPINAMTDHEEVPKLPADLDMMTTKECGAYFNILRLYFF